MLPIRLFFSLLVFLSVPWAGWCHSTEEEVARALLEAQDSGQRSAILAQHPEVTVPDLVGALVEMSHDFLVRAENERAEAAATLAIDVAQKGPELTAAQAAFQLGLVHYFRENYDAALDDFKRCLAVREKTSDQAEVSLTLTYIGNCYRQKGDFAGARSYYEKSLALCQSPGKERALAAVLNSLCLMDQDENHYDRAQEECDRSVLLRRQLNDRGDLAESLIAAGRLQYFKENYDGAIEKYRESLQTFEAIGSIYRSAFLSSSMGDAYLLQGKYAQALEAFDKTIQISDVTGSLRFKAWALLRIGELHDTQGNYDVAMDYARKALEAFQKIQLYNVYPARARALIGTISLHQGRFDEAMTWYQQAIDAFRKIDSKGDIAFLYNEMGRAEHRRHNLEAAEKHFSLALEQAEASGSKYLMSLVLNDRGHLAIEQKKYGEALEDAKRAAAYAGEAGTYNILFESLQVMGQAFSGLGDARQARDSLDQSISIVEDLRSEVAGGEEDRELFLADRIQPYHAMIDLLWKLNDVPGAFVYAERAKARVLLDSLSGSRTDPQNFMTGQEKTREQDQTGRMASLNLQLLNENQKPNPDQAVLQDLKTRLQQVRAEHEALFAAVYASHPELRMQRGEVPTAALMEGASRLLGTDAALLEYVVTESRIYLFVLCGSTQQVPVEMRIFPLELNREDLSAKVESFRNSLANLDLGFAERSQELYRLLLAPAESMLYGKENLLIVPDGELWNLPFSALRMSGGRYLLEAHTLIELPSLAALSETRKFRQENPAPGSLLFALGNPELAEPTAKRIGTLSHDATLGALPDSEEEVLKLAEIYGKTNSRVYVGKEAREDRFKAEASGFRILHIATHGILNNRAPLYSQLVLAPGQAPTSEDGLLEAWEIMGLRLNARLAVLSACETGRGKVGSGEGMIGLSWAFQLSGVPTTIVSQWKVESKSTTDLMVRFHQNLLKKDATSRFPVAEALRRAALELLKRPGSAHPFYWAGFVVIGPASLS